MSWLKKAKAVARIAAESTTQAAKGLANTVEAELGNEDWYKKAKRGAREIGREAAEVWSDAKSLGAEAAEDFSSTEFGKAVGKKTRELGQVLSSLPVFSLATDIVKNRHGVPELYVMFQNQPNDPQNAIWLAEALERVQSDLTNYSRFRSITSPTYALMNQSLKVASKLGEVPSDPTQLRLLKLAFTGSIRQLQQSPRNGKALHVLARVYLSQRDFEEAIRYAKLAILARPQCGLPWLTLARTYLALEQDRNAKKAAQKAVDLGQDYGREILADIYLMSKQTLTLMDLQSYDNLRASISPHARIAYMGVSVEGVGMLEGIGKDQLSKLERMFA